MRGLKVKRDDCEALLNFLRERNFLVKGVAFKRSGSEIIVPISRQLGAGEVASLNSLGIQYEEIEDHFIFREPRPSSLIECLNNRLPPYLLASVPRSYDLIGDILVLELPEELKDHKRLIGEAAMNVHKNIRLVLNKVSDISGIFRIGKYEVIAGEGSTETVHKEHGCLYKLDPTKVFFTPRLSTERGRVASQVKMGEIIADLFAGVGPFSILIAKRVQETKVYSVDINPSAIKYLEENIRLNHVEGRVFAILGDAKDVAESHLIGKCNRVIMNLPAGSELFLESASKVLLPEGGFVHMHIFINQLEKIDERVSSLEKKFRSLGWESVEILHVKTIREVGTRNYHTAIDFRLTGRKEDPLN
ncbi:MAG: class I SAM-dependent methyltransferase [Thermoproteota archaeon]